MTPISSAKPTLAVIGGTGAEGSGLVLRWAAAGYPVIIGSRSQEKAATVAAALSAELPAGCSPIT
ncbi:MAG: NAD(P)-binding domain-containing protein, partial [Caldilineaceae bacterium]